MDEIRSRFGGRRLRAEQPDFGRLFARCEPRIYGYIRTLVPNRTDAEEVLQETASLLWQKFDQFQAGTNFLGWALTVARFQVLYYRQRKERERLLFSDTFANKIAEETAESGDRMADLRAILADCLAKLPKEDRELFRRRYESDITSKRLAEALGRPATTVYNALARIRRVLAGCVQRTLASENRT